MGCLLHNRQAVTVGVSVLLTSHILITDAFEAVKVNTRVQDLSYLNKVPWEIHFLVEPFLPIPTQALVASPFYRPEWKVGGMNESCLVCGKQVQALGWQPGISQVTLCLRKAAFSLGESQG